MAKRSIKELFGNRVALQLLEEEYQGLVVPAPTQSKIHVISKVMAVGDKASSAIKVNDILFWQTNAMIEAHCRYQLNGVPTFVLGTTDMIARLTANTEIGQGKDARLTAQVINLANFHVIGDWLLIRKVVIEPSKLIILPDEVKDANQDMTVKFLVEQLGDTVCSKGGPVEIEVAVGDDLIVDRTKANPIKLGDDHFFYLHKNFVLGKVG